ncbi:carbonic anhydrase [Sphingosinithalassobacter sp. LHW66-3]|uniref:carbonic anhydrase n=1 Tax=Sphingosinithalassobacter sp. LHW66-3 TaxID=3424718 RepID=UPI003D6A1C26
MAIRSGSIAMLLGAAALAGCTVADTPPATGAHGATWGYEGATGPSAWGEISEDYALCTTGRQGSPVNLHDAIPAALGPVAIGWQPVEGEVVDTGHGVQVNVANAGGFTSRDHRYELLQFHFHTPAEHLLQGRRFPLEAHFVHRREDGMLGVIGVFVQEGTANPALQAVLDELEGERGAAARLAITNLLPQEPAVYRYAGSLTTPPCSETVDWFVMEQPITGSPEQIAALARLYADNARPVQPLNRRFILRSD